MDELAPEGHTDLREYLQILRRRWLSIALTVIVVLAVALAYSFVKSPTYTASAKVLLPQQQVNSALNPGSAQLPASDALQRSLSDEQQFAEGQATKSAATTKLGFKANVTVTASTTSDLLTFTANSGSQAQAAAIANAYANGYIKARLASEVAKYTDQVTALQSSISALQAKATALPAADPQQAALQQSVNSLTQSVQQLQAAAQLATQSGPTVLTAATPPTSPSSPQPVRNGILGFVVGLLLGIGVAFVTERLDEGIRSRQDAEVAAGGLPVVGLIPMVDSWRPAGSHHLALVEDSTSHVSEAYRTLRTSIQFLSIDEPKHVIGVTSPGPDEGKSTTVANLAISFARAGQRVIVVSCDLRRPRLHVFFGVDNSVGFTSVLAGQSPLAEAMKPMPDEPGIKVLTSGPVPPNPAELLSLDRVREIVDALSDNCDVVLLDCPPVLPVTDTLLISRLVDGMMVVGSARTTSKRDLRRCVELLEQVTAPMMGLILNRVPQDGGYAYGYGYGYGYRYDSERTPRAEPQGTNPLATDNLAVNNFGVAPSPQSGFNEPSPDAPDRIRDVERPAKSAPVSPVIVGVGSQPDGPVEASGPHRPPSPELNQGTHLQATSDLDASSNGAVLRSYESE